MINALKRKRKETEKNLEMAKGHTDKGVDGDYEEAPTKEGTLKDEQINPREIMIIKPLEDAISSILSRVFKLNSKVECSHFIYI